jgi:CheY-like chemotaxis protein
MSKSGSVTREVELYIVIADDDLEDHELIKKAVKECDLNYIVTSVYNGMQLMNLLLRKGFYKTEFTHNPDLVILDLKMPIMDGYEALRQIRSNPGLQDIPVYVITESDTADDRKKLVEAGADGFYTKPFSFDELLKLVGTICHHTIARHPNKDSNN